MPVTYQIEPVNNVVRAFINAQLVSAGNPMQLLPTLNAIAQYPFDPTLCPLFILDPVNTSADWSRYAVGDVAFTLELNLHTLRIRSGSTVSEETTAISTLCTIAAGFASDYRLGGSVQSVEIESITIAEPTLYHRLGIPTDEFQSFAAATLKMHIVWIESCFAAA